MSDDLAAFLRARNAEVERYAKDLVGPYGPRDVSGMASLSEHMLREVKARRMILDAYEAAVARQIAAAGGRADEPEWHIARRLALHFACAVSADVWSDHPDWQRDWGRVTQPRA